MTYGIRGTRRRIGRGLLIAQVLLCLLCASLADARHRRSKESKEDPPAAAQTPTAPTPAPAAPSASTPAPSQAPAASSAPADTSASQDPCLSDPKCSEMYEKARALSRANQYEASLVLYQQTYAMKPLPWLLLNIGRVQQKLGRHDQAAVTYRKILDFNAKLPPDETSGLADAEVTTKAREYLTQAEQAIAEQKKLNPNAVSTGPVDKVPVYKKWWFWTAISGGVGLAALGIGLGVGLSSAGSGPRVPNGIDVFQPTF